MKPILHTQRFTLIPYDFSSEHNAHLLEMMQSEKVQKYIRGHAYSDQEVAESFAKIKQNSTDKFGMWLIFDDADCAGMCLLKSLPSTNPSQYYETGYWLKPASWGKGIAGEVATRMVKYAFDELNLNCVVAVTHIDNIASQKSLEKAGLTRQGNINAYDLDLPFFKIDNPHHMACSKPTISTERFRLIPWRNNPDHNQAMVWMMKSKQVQEYVNGKAYTDEQINKIIPTLSLATNQQRGFGIWMIYDMASHNETCVGTVFLKYTPDDEPHPYEVGYWLMPKHWQKAIAAEVADHIVNYGFEQLNLPHIVATTENENIASQKSLLNIGFTRIADIIEDGVALPFFKRKNPRHKKSNKPILHTERFTLLPWVDSPEFKQHMTEMMQDADVQKYVYEHALSNDEMSAQLSRMTEICKSASFGYWIVYEADTCVGMALLKPTSADDSKNCGEVGYWLKQAHWGKAIAAEVATRLIKYGFQEAKLDAINALTHPDNIGSQKSLVKAGLLDQGTITYKNEDIPYFKLTRAEYQA